MVAGNVANARFNFQASGKGTPATASAYGVYLAGGGLVVGMGENAYFEETTGNQMRSDTYAVERHGGGNPEILARPKATAGLLYAVLGADSVTGASDPYTHEITKATSLPWMTWWSHLGGLAYDEISDAKVSQLVISGQSGQPIRLAATVEALRPRHQAAEETTVDVETGDAFVYYDGDGALKFEGSAVSDINSFVCTINRNVTRVMGDGLTPVDLTEGLFTIEWQLTMLMSSASLLKRILYGSATPSNDAEVTSDVLELAGSPAGIDFKFTMTAASRTLQIECPTLTVDPFDVPPNTDGSPLYMTINARAFDDGTNEPITATVLNSMADLTP